MSIDILSDLLIRIRYRSISVTAVCGSEPVVPLGFYWMNAAAERAPPAPLSSPPPASAPPPAGDVDLLIWTAPPPRSAAGPEMLFAPAVAVSPACQLLPHIQQNDFIPRKLKDDATKAHRIS